MAEALVSFVIEELAFFIRDYIKDEVGILAGAREEVEKLTDTFEKIQAVLEDAENQQIKDKSVKLWLQKLKNSAYEIEDVLDEWKTRILVSQLDGSVGIGGSNGSKKKVSSYFLALCSCFGKVTLHHDTGRKIKVLREKLDTIADEKEKFRLNYITRIEETIMRTDTSSLINSLEICGRDSDKKIIISKLLSESSQAQIRVPVISIVGMGGLGKTALAQLVFNDDEITSHFEKKVWVCVSDPFDITKLAIKIIEALGDSVPIATVTQWQTLHKQLCISFKDKKLLVVLDDVWTKDTIAWSHIKFALDHCAKGSRVIVTTRNGDVSITVGSSYNHDLAKLNDQDCWLLFRSLAFNGRGEDDCSKLESIGRKISDKCQGLPIFVKTLGCLMPHKKTVKDWEDVNGSYLWELQTVNESILPAFLLSYNALPSHLKRCFTFCAVYEKNWRLDKDLIVKQWMSHNYIISSQGRDLETIGGEYFDDLVSRSFFNNLITMSGKVYCTMHDLVHDFANFVTNNECSIIEGDGNKLDFAKTRHLLLRLHEKELNPFLSSIRNANYLRSLLIGGEGEQIPLPEVNLLSQFTSLRILDLSYTAIESLSNEIGSLIHLRYLDLSETKLVELPETITNLRNLQTLKLNSCKVFRQLPQGLGNLNNLRHLEIDSTYSLKCLPQGLRRLKHLQTLTQFMVSEGGCQLQELGDLNKLKGRLCIRDIKGASEVVGDAKLKHKPYLSKLELTFKKEAYEGKDIHDTTALELLEPPSGLEDLRIWDYGGSMLPTWMELLTNISKLIISYCYKLEVLPSFTDLTSLKYLQLDGLDLISPNALFSDTYLKLKTLIIKDMNHWEEWEMETVGDTTTFMPSLQLLEICNCPILKSLPRQILLDSVIEMHIKKCPELTVPFLPPLLQKLQLLENAGSLSTSLPFQNNTTLTRLQITESPHSSLPKGIPQLKALQTLVIQDCNSLKRVVEDLRPITSLENLSIWRCLILEGDWSILSHISQIWIDDERIK